MESEIVSKHIFNFLFVFWMIVFPYYEISLSLLGSVSSASQISTTVWVWDTREALAGQARQYYCTSLAFKKSLTALAEHLSLPGTWCKVM